MTTPPTGPPAGFAKSVGEYYDRYVTVADAKAGLLLGVDIGLATLLLGHLPESPWGFWMGWAAIGSYAGSGLAGAATVWPRVPSIGKSLVFWEDVQQRTLENYCAEVARLDEAAVEDEYVRQVWFVSRVLHGKHVYIRWCIALFAIASVCACLSVWLGEGS